MLKVTVDVFSGRLDPSWRMTGSEAHTILKELASHPGAIAPKPPPHDPLGYYATHIEVEDLTVRRELNLPAKFSIVGPTTFGHQKGHEILQRILDQAPAGIGQGILVDHPPGTSGLGGFFSGHDLRPILKRAVQVRPVVHSAAIVHSAVTVQSAAMAAPYRPPSPPTHRPPPPPPHRPPPPPPHRPPSPHPTPPPSPFTSCGFEVLGYNPTAWNNPAHILRNNCYAYATNHMTDTFPQPGRATGHQATSMSAGPVSNGAKSDGAHDAGNCFAASFAPRLLVALVIWPGVDYHWYRWHGSFWGHKPGGTAVRNIDNSGLVITDPRAANRGGYSIFYGFMLIPNTQHVR